MVSAAWRNWRTSPWSGQRRKIKNRARSTEPCCLMIRSKRASRNAILGWRPSKSSFLETWKTKECNIKIEEFAGISHVMRRQFWVTRANRQTPKTFSYCGVRVLSIYFISISTTLGIVQCCKSLNKVVVALKYENSVTLYISMVTNLRSCEVQSSWPELLSHDNNTVVARTSNTMMLHDM